MSIHREVRVCTERELPQGASRTFLFAGRKGLFVHTVQGVKGYMNACTHMGGPLQLCSHRLVCAWHGAEFDASTGRALSGQAPPGSALTPVKALLRDGVWYAVMELQDDPFG